MKTKTRTIKVLTLNIHKGFSMGNQTRTLNRIKKNIKASNVDVVCLQEVVGHHAVHDQNSQFEYLADRIWSHYSYGKNAIYSKGHHGNATLSHFPFLFQENIDVSNNRFERRGILHGIVSAPDWGDQKLHVLNLHFDLTEKGRLKQLKRLSEVINNSIPKADPLMVCGDFNDWNQAANSFLEKKCGLIEVFQSSHGQSARTFPSFFPVFRLDRIFVRGLTVKKALCLKDEDWNKVSDHLALYAELEWPLLTDERTTKL